MTSAVRSEYTIGLDLGGGSVRCLLLDLTTGRTFCAHHGYALRSAPGTGGLGFDLDLADIRVGFAVATRAAMARAGADADQIVGIAATAIRLGTILLDRRGDVLLAVPNRDARAIGPGLSLAARHGEALNATTGRWPYPFFAAARLLWLAETQPDAMARTAHFLSVSDWITWLLTGEITADPSQAGESLLFDQGAADWSWEWIDRLELPRRLFPSLAPCGSAAGVLTGPAAELLGLRPGTPVSVGGADTQCGLLGTGAVAPGDLAVIAGSTAPLQLVTGRATIDSEARVWTGQHVVPKRCVLESNAGPVGDTLDWFARMLYPDAGDLPVRTAMLLAEAAESTPGAAGMLSTLGIEVMNARTRGIPIGNLTLSHMTSESDPRPRKHLLRSIVEGVACGLRANAEQLYAIADEPTAARLRLAGGLSRSPFLAQVLANVLAAPVEVAATAEASALGAALCAAVGAERFSDLEVAAANLLCEPTIVEPDADAADAHRDLYQRWCQLRTERTAADRTAAALVTPFVLGAQAGPVGPRTTSYRPKILITSDCDDTSLAALRKLGDVEYASFRDRKRMLSGPSLVEALKGVQVFVTEIDLVDVDALEALPELRVIVSCRGDAVNVDAAACTAFGVPMLRTPGRNADAVADLTLAFLLMLARKLPEASQFLREGVAAGDMGKLGQAFGQFRGRELWNKTVGLVGLGAVGRKVCRRLRAFGAHVIVADPFVSPERAALAGAQSVTLAELLRTSDFVSLHAAVTPETMGMLGAAEFAAMKPAACLINTARAALLDEEELVDALRDGVIAGAALDTFAVEPPGSDHPLLALPNVIATPHMGGNTADVAAHQGEIVVDELTRLLAGEPPHFATNPEAVAAFDWNTPRPYPSAAVLAKLREGPPPAVSDLQQKKQQRRAK